jgi:hypothetical protein
MTIPMSRRDVVAPGPRGSLLLGLARDLQRDPLATFDRAAATYGDVVRLTAGPPGRRVALHLVSHPDGVQQVLTNTSDAYTKGTPFYREIAAYLGDGLLTSTGHRWRQQRRTLAPRFSHRRIQRQIDGMAAEADRLICYLACVGVLYGVTAGQASASGPLWWPVLVGAASLPALAALGFAAGALLRSRYTLRWWRSARSS